MAIASSAVTVPPLEKPTVPDRIAVPIDANTVCLVNPDTWVLYYPEGRKGFIETREISDFQDRMNKKDVSWVMTAKGSMICKFPPQNGVITSAG